MKKVFAVVAVLLVVVLCLCGCVGKKKYNKLNDMLQQDYRRVSVAVTSTNGDKQLKSTFEVTAGDGTKVHYIVEQFALLDADTVQSNFKNVYEGTVIIRNGEIVSQSGDLENLNLEATNFKGLNFSKKYFKKAKIKKGTFTAKVTDPQAFMGNADLQCQSGSMQVEATFEKAFKQITITYQTPTGTNMVVTYSFIK